MAKPPTNRSDLDRAKFILATMASFQRDFEAGIYHHEKRDLFCEIRHPDGQGGSLPIGRDAYDMLCELAETAITKAALNGRTNVDTARSILGPILVQSVSVGGAPVAHVGSLEEHHSPSLTETEEPEPPPSPARTA